VPAGVAFRFLCDGQALGRWALGAFATRRVAPGLYRGTSLFDGGKLLVRPVGDAPRLTVRYFIGTRRDALEARILARVHKRGARRCVVSLEAQRPPRMGAARWRRLAACHEVEVLLIQAQLERGRG